MQKSALKSAIATALGITALAASSAASAGVMSANWTGYFIVLDPAGNALANTSLSAKSNQLVTQVSGTLQFDDVTGAGTATLVPFEFFGNDYSTMLGINLQWIGDGMGGPGSLVLSNMLFSWSGSGYGSPVSLVLDAAGLFGAYGESGYSLGQIISGVGAIAATDGTYVGSQPGSFEDANGYLAMGAMPMVTTAWNTSLAPGCVIYSCMGINPSGLLPLVFDTTPNEAYDGPNTGGSIGGSPMADGPFTGSNINLNFASITFTGYDPNTMLPPVCDFGYSCPPPGEVPVPAAAWLFGSGLLGLLGVVRRRKD